jgi:arylsulfatase A-like enzyme
MTNSVSRRDFLKLAALTSLTLSVPPLIKSVGPLPQPQGGRQNVLVVVFDALSAYHISMYGYGRKTTPNLARLAERAVVYHNHFAAGSFTVPGTASLLTSVLPWKHRAFRFEDGVVDAYVKKSIFHAFESYYRIAYSHNPNVVRFLNQFADDLTDFVPYEQLLLTSNGLVQSLFKNDDDTANVAWSRIMVKDRGLSYSLLLSSLYKQYNENKINTYKRFFPIGVPTIKGDDHFLLEDAINWLNTQILKTPQPFLGYFHLMPPHDPYTPPSDFYGYFENDGLQVAEKPNDIFAPVRPFEFMLTKRREYDEYILYLDREFGRFFDHIESSGLLENTWVIFTSDHGELFERGIQGHITPSFYQPLVRVPLLIFPPGSKTRTDIHALTSAVDVLPTLLHITGQKAADWTDGVVLPPFASSAPDPERKVYAFESYHSEQNAVLKQATGMLVKGKYKLVYYSGYYDELGAEGKLIQLFDIESDPEELNDLSTSEKEIASALIEELKTKYREINEPFL